jgi:histidyl-tRNA synthetase
MLFRSPRGTKDILPPESRYWQEVEAKARRVFATFAFEEIRTPLIEEAKLFSRSLGDLTDIVQKQMFLIKKETDTFVLRPEATAAIIRSYVENTVYNTNTVTRFYYIGPMFRAERPQKGRLRQFHHIGCESIGSYHPFLDAEAVFLATRILDEIGIEGYEVVLNTLGCANDKKDFSLKLKEKLLPHRPSFCEDCQGRMEKNVFRVLDCKNRQCRNLIVELNIGDAHICDDCRKHFEQVREGLGLLGVKFRVDPLLVRGLDYYTRSVFEITHAGLGAQDAIGAGGRYDNLVKELGGPERGAVGFALGVERLLLAKGAADAGELSLPSANCYLVPLGAAASRKSLEILKDLRLAGVATDMDFIEGSLKASLRRADSRKARFCVIIGDNELAKGVCLLKDMKEGRQEEVALDQIVNKVMKGCDA